MFPNSKRSRQAVLLAVLAGAACVPVSAIAQERENGGRMHGMEMHGDRMSGEAMRPPRGYSPPVRPPETVNRPHEFERRDYNHNFAAPHGFAIGPYHAPHGYRYRHWRFGEFLPRPYWTSNYFLSDYWLFGLDMPPIGYEWVRYGPDALLIDDTTGEIVQVVYGAFI